MHLVNVEPLLDASFDWFHATGFGGYVYASARSFVAMLESDDELAQRLAAYIARLRDGAGSDCAWAESFAGVDVHELQVALRSLLLRRGACR